MSPVPSYSGEPVARIYEFEVYGPDGRVNLALNRPATGSSPCSQDQGPEKAVNGSVAGGQADKWCAQGWPLFLQVDLGCGSSGDALRREARQCGRRKRGVRHPRLQHPAEQRREDLHHGRLVYGRRVRRRADRVSPARLLRRAAGGAAPFRRRQAAAQGHQPPARSSKRIGRSSRGSSSTSTCGWRSSSAVWASS